MIHTNTHGHLLFTVYIHNHIHKCCCFYFIIMLPLFNHINIYTCWSHLHIVTYTYTQSYMHTYITITYIHTVHKLGCHFIGVHPFIWPIRFTYIFTNTHIPNRYHNISRNENRNPKRVIYEQSANWNIHSVIIKYTHMRTVHGSRHTIHTHMRTVHRSYTQHTHTRSHTYKPSIHTPYTLHIHLTRTESNRKQNPRRPETNRKL